MTGAWRRKVCEARCGTWGGLLAVVWASLGCGSSSPVERGVLLVVDGDATVRERVRRVEVHVEGRGAEGGWEEAGHFVLENIEPLRWPLRGALEPKGGSAGRSFQITVEGYESALGGDGTPPLVVARVRSEFVGEGWRRLHVFLASACFEVQCEDEESCRLGVCVPVERETEELGNDPGASRPPCERDSECDDGEPCTVDRCVEGRCVGVRPEEGGLAFRSVALGQYDDAAHACAIDVLNRLWCWGSNGGRQLGLDHTVDRLEPTRVEYIEDGVQQVSLGGRDGCAVLFDGGLWCWGNGEGGILGDRPGRRLPPAQVPGLAGERVEQVAVGAVAACARLQNGEVRCWGNGSYGALGTSRWGESSGEPRPVDGLPRATELAAGSFHMGILDEAGVPWRWGAERPVVAEGFQPVMEKMDTLLSPAVQLSMRGYSMCMVGERGEVWCRNTSFRGELVTLGGVGSPARINGLVDERIVRVGVGKLSVLALDEQLRLWSWGANAAGQLATGDTQEQRTPRLVASSLRFVDIEAAGNFSCAVDVLQRLWCWGDNTVGQLGVGDTEPRLEPVRVGADLSCP